MQLALPMKVVVEKTINELQMGVLEDGTAYLSARGLARACGVVPSAVISQGANWAEGKRDGRLAKMLMNAGITRETLHLPTGGSEHAYPDDICMIFLEYYAFEVSSPNRSRKAQEMYRLFARAGMRAFVYNALGYKPNQVAPEHWRKYYDRLMLNPLPAGYFSVFREMGDLVVTAAQNGLPLDEHTVPDISIGMAWSQHWQESGAEERFGQRKKYPHRYPAYFPQAKAGIEAWIYPLAALSEFWIWMQDTYVPEKFPKYLSRQVTKGALPAGAANVILAAVEPKRLPDA